MTIFTHTDTVRDNELDAQGIVNHANYFIYLAHCRHQHIRSLGIDFVALHLQGFDLVLVKTNTHFKKPLFSGNIYQVTSKIEKESPIRYVFHQTIIRLSDQALVLTSENTTSCIDRKRNRPKFPDFLTQLLANPQ